MTNERCLVCEMPDSDHLDWCTQQARDEENERARMEAFYRARQPHGHVGWGRDKTGAYHAQFARDAWAAWQEARRQVEPTGAQRHVDEIVPAAALPPELQGLADSFAKAFGNSPRRIEPDIREKVFGNAAGTMARKLDAAIADALNRFLPDGWTMDDVKRRCVRVKGPNSDVETLCMDGVPLLEIHPIEMEKVPNETGFSVRFTQKYRDLKPLNRGGSRDV